MICPQEGNAEVPATCLSSLGNDYWSLTEPLCLPWNLTLVLHYYDSYTVVVIAAAA
jgi:hypothetical protein